MAKLRYNFTFPFRWLKEDKKYLKQNLTRNLPLHKNKMTMHQALLDDEPPVYSYGVRFKQYAYQPKAYSMTKEEITDILEDVFPNAKCMVFEKFFVQRSSQTGLPVMEIELFY